MGGWEAKIDFSKVFTLSTTRPLTAFGIGALAKLDDVLTELSVAGQDKILVVTDATAAKASGAWENVLPMLSRHVAWELFDGVRPNPTYANCEAAAKCGKRLGAKAVLAIGGGSVIDTAKTAAVLLRHPVRKAADFYEKGAPITGALPIVAVNTTHGSGSEVSAFAVAQADGENKPALHSPHLYPRYAIEDPTLTASMPTRSTVSTTMDALAHAVEAACSTNASPYTHILAKEAVRLIAGCLPAAITQPANLTVRAWLLYASAIAGMAADAAMPHLVHAMEHAMSTLNADIGHGEGLGMLLPAVLRELYPAAPQSLAEVLAPIAPGLSGVPGEAAQAADRLAAWLTTLGHPTGMGMYFTGADIPALTRLTLKSSLSKMLLPFSPIRVETNLVERTFQHAL